jgi:FMN reductase
LEGAAASGAEVQLIWVRDLGLPLYTPEHAVPAGAHEFADAVYASDAMIWSSPTYHGSVSGSFKNALDWLILLAERTPPYLSNKPAGLVCTAGGVQGLQAVNSMDFIARALRGWSVPLVLPVAQSWQSFDPDGNLTDEGVSRRSCAGSARRWCARPASSRPRAPATTPTTGSSPPTATPSSPRPADRPPDQPATQPNPGRLRHCPHPGAKGQDCFTGS